MSELNKWFQSDDKTNGEKSNSPNNMSYSEYLKSKKSKSTYFTSNNHKKQEVNTSLSNLKPSDYLGRFMEYCDENQIKTLIGVGILALGGILGLNYYDSKIEAGKKPKPESLEYRIEKHDHKLDLTNFVTQLEKENVKNKLVQIHERSQSQIVTISNSNMLKALKIYQKELHGKLSQTKMTVRTMYSENPDMISEGFRIFGFYESLEQYKRRAQIEIANNCLDSRSIRLMSFMLLKKLREEGISCEVIDQYAIKKILEYTLPPNFKLRAGHKSINGKFNPGGVIIYNFD